MKLLIIRHGKAEDFAPNGGDEGRLLTNKGWRQAEAVGKCLKMLDWVPELFLTSPRTRAFETCLGVMKAVGALGEPVIQSWLDFEMTNEDTWGQLGALDGVERVAIFGHEPSFSSFTQWLLQSQASVEVKKASLIGLTIYPPQRTRTILHFAIPPKALL